MVQEFPPISSLIKRRSHVSMSAIDVMWLLGEPPKFQTFALLSYLASLSVDWRSVVSLGCELLNRAAMQGATLAAICRLIETLCPPLFKREDVNGDDAHAAFALTVAAIARAGLIPAAAHPMEATELARHRDKWLRILSAPVARARGLAQVRTLDELVAQSVDVVPRGSLPKSESSHRPTNRRFEPGESTRRVGATRAWEKDCMNAQKVPAHVRHLLGRQRAAPPACYWTQTVADIRLCSSSRAVQALPSAINSRSRSVHHERNRKQHARLQTPPTTRRYADRWCRVNRSATSRTTASPSNPVHTLGAGVSPFVPSTGATSANSVRLSSARFMLGQSRTKASATA